MIVQRVLLMLLWSGCSLMGVPEHPPAPDAGSAPLPRDPTELAETLLP